MNGLQLLLSAAAIGAAPAPAAPVAPISLSGPVKHDVQCFMLYALAVQGAVTKNDEKMKQAAGLGVMYFFTRLKIEAPTLDLYQTIRQEAEAMKAGPELTAVGDACDKEFQKQGTDLRDLGQRLKDVGSQTSTSS